MIFECFSILNFETRYKVGNIDRIQHVDCDCKNLSTAYRFFYGHVTLARPSCGKRGERVRERDSEGERERQTASQPDNSHTNLVLSEQAEVRQQKFSTLAKIKLRI